jgi:hypothetical protein
MGLQAECTVRMGRKTAVGRALLETKTLIFRGELSLRLAFDRICKVAVRGGVLIVQTPDQEARFELGNAVATRWARMIKEPKGLFDKLDVTSQSRIAVVGVMDPVFVASLRERVASVAQDRVPEGATTIFFGAETRAALRKVPLLRARMVETETLWIVRPKGSRAISESDVLGTIRSAGLVDTKVVAFSGTHTAHKCVIPVEQRGRPAPVRAPIAALAPLARRSTEHQVRPDHARGPRSSKTPRASARAKGRPR